MVTKQNRGLNIFRDAHDDAEALTHYLRFMDDRVLTFIDIAVLQGKLIKLLRSIQKVTGVNLHPGDELSLELPARPEFVPDNGPDPVQVEIVMNDDVIDGMEEDGFFDNFTAGPERTRAFHAIATLDDLTIHAQPFPSTNGRARWIVLDLEDALLNAMLIMAGKTLTTTE